MLCSFTFRSFPGLTWSLALLYLCVSLLFMVVRQEKLCTSAYVKHITCLNMFHTSTCENYGVVSGQTGSPEMVHVSGSTQAARFLGSLSISKTCLSLFLRHLGTSSGSLCFIATVLACACGLWNYSRNIYKYWAYEAERCTKTGRPSKTHW